MQPYPAAYIRRSYVDPQSPGDISKDAQLAAVRRLATADGHNGDLREYSDWGISADVAKAAQRTEYGRLLADMEQGRVTAVYAFDVDRLYRDPRDLIRLQDAAQRHRVKIVTTGGELAIGDGDDPAAEAFAFIGSIFGRMELQKAKKRNRAARDARLARGDRFGHAPYGFRHIRDEGGRIVRVPDPARPIQPLLDAYRDAGSILGACRLLEDRHVPAPKGGARWATSALTRILEANAPELLPQRNRVGRRLAASAPLSHLLVCPFCGKTMTPNVHRRQYYCSNGPRDRDNHPRYTVREQDIMPALEQEAARLHHPVAGLDDANGAARRDALNEKRARWIEQYAEGVVDKATRDAKLQTIDAELSAIAARSAAAAVVPDAVDWSWPTTALNDVLRALWERVELGADMMPARFVWHVPEWRA